MKAVRRSPIAGSLKKENELLSHAKNYKIAMLLALITIFYNIVEGLFSVFFGVEDDSLTLFGFGIDSFIEVISGIGIVIMVYRIRRYPHTERSKFEKTALIITGCCFYLLCLVLFAMIIHNLWLQKHPVTTVWGIIISVISILTMWLLAFYKVKIGNKLDSAPILADVGCTKVCIYMSVILLISSLIYEMIGIGYIDSIGTLGIIWFSWQEGREAFAKATGKECTCCK